MKTYKINMIIKGKERSAIVVSNNFQQAEKDAHVTFSNDNTFIYSIEEI